MSTDCRVRNTVKYSRLADAPFGGCPASVCADRMSSRQPPSCCSVGAGSAPSAQWRPRACYACTVAAQLSGMCALRLAAVQQHCCSEADLNSLLLALHMARAVCIASHVHIMLCETQQVSNEGALLVSCMRCKLLLCYRLHSRVQAPQRC